MAFISVADKYSPGLRKHENRAEYWLEIFQHDRPRTEFQDSKRETLPGAEVRLPQRPGRVGEAGDEAGKGLNQSDVDVSMLQLQSLIMLKTSSYFKIYQTQI